MKRRTLVPMFLLLFAVVVSAKETKYLTYDTDLIPPEEYQTQRQAFLKMLKPDDLAIFYAAPEHTRNNDVEYSFRQDDKFFYLTGFNEPNAILVLVPNGIPVSAFGETS